MLEFDGRKLSGNGTVSRYLAEKYSELISKNFIHFLHLFFEGIFREPITQFLCIQYLKIFVAYF